MNPRPFRLPAVECAVNAARTGRILSFAALIASAVLVAPTSAFAVGDSGTSFSVYVPPNDSTSARMAGIAVTSLNPGTTIVNIVDTNEDGDNDDTYSNVSLEYGQSMIVFPRHSTVDDDRDGKRDGDFFLVDANRPVILMQFTTSDWQHDWVPTDGKGGLGMNFVIYQPQVSGSNGDINVFAYSNGTEVYVEDITDMGTGKGTTLTTGKTNVNFTTKTRVLYARLDEGQDLHFTSRQGIDVLTAGRSYLVRATKPITAVFGHLGSVANADTARDGAGFITSDNGSSVGTLWYFRVPANNTSPSEKELRVVSFEDGAQIELTGKLNADDTIWRPISTATLNAFRTFDITGASNTTFRDFGLYRLRVLNNKKVAAYEANWMETGSIGTSDDLAWLSASNGRGVGYNFLAYMGPAGNQGNTAVPAARVVTPTVGNVTSTTWSALYIAADRADATVTVEDTATGGTVYRATATVPAGQYRAFRISGSQWTSLNNVAQGRRPYLRITSSAPVSVANANHNDNWLGFASRRDLPGAEVLIETIVGSLPCGVSGPVGFVVRNVGTETANNVRVQYELGPGVSLQSSTGALGQPTGDGITPLDDLGWWLIPSIAPGQEIRHTFNVVADCGEPGLPQCLADAARLPAVRLTATGDMPWGGTRSETQANLTLIDPSRPTITSTDVTTGRGFRNQPVMYAAVQNQTPRRLMILGENGALTLVANLAYAAEATVPWIHAMAFGIDGNLYGIDDATPAQRLVRINPTTAVITPIAAVNSNRTTGNLWRSLAAHPDGFLYATVRQSITINGTVFPAFVAKLRYDGTVAERIGIAENAGPAFSDAAFVRAAENSSFACQALPTIVDNGVISLGAQLRISDKNADAFSDVFTFNATVVSSVATPVFDPLSTQLATIRVGLAELRINPASRQDVRQDPNNPASPIVETRYALVSQTLSGGFTLTDLTNSRVVLSAEIVTEGGYISLSGGSGVLVAKVRNPTVNNTRTGSVILDYFSRQPAGWTTPLLATFQYTGNLLNDMIAGRTIDTSVSASVKAEAAAQPAVAVCQ